jgi:hypothetical protein
MRAKWLGQFILFAAAAATGALISPLAAQGEAEPRVTRFDEISVNRLNIVEPNGRPRLILANSARFPGLWFEGREYRHHSRSGGGMWFVNDDGDEVGGLTYRSNAGNRSASAGITFDQYKQDQTVSMLYSESNGQRQAGMRVWDRPDASIGPLMAMSDRAARAPNDAERQRIREEMRAWATANGGGGAERYFAGKIQGDAIVRLADPQGRARLVMRVGNDGVPSIEFLDADGRVTRRIAAE